MAKILILISGHLYTAPRSQKEAETLANAGHTVIVKGVWHDPVMVERDIKLETNPYLQTFMSTPIILTPETLISKLQSLPPEQLQQVLDFVEFLAQKYGHAVTHSTQPKLPRVLGLYEGKGWVSEDFDSPLPDEFWLGQS